MWLRILCDLAMSYTIWKIKALKTYAWHLSRELMKEISSLKQEGQDGPGSLTWVFEITLAIFLLSLSEKNLQELLYVCTVQVAPVH